MNEMKALNARYEVTAWGLIFLWLGILMIVPGDQGNLFVLGIGVILLTLNLARSARGIAMNWFSTILGALALGLGGIGLLWPWIGGGRHFEVDIFPIIMLVIGLYLLIPGQKKEHVG